MAAPVGSWNAYVAPASVIFDNANSTSGTTVANLTTTSWTIAGSNRALIGMMGWSAGSPPTYSAIKWEGSSGTALTQHGSTLSNSAARLAIARLVAPNATSGTLYGELSGTADEFCLGGVSVTNADQTSPLGTAVTATVSGGASPANFTASSIANNSNDMLLSFAYAFKDAGTGTITIAPNQGQTSRWEREGIASVATGGCSTMVAGSPGRMTEVYTIAGDTCTGGVFGVAITSSGG